MSLFAKNSLEYQIINHLQKRPWVIVDLISELQKTRPGLSKQAVYQTIRLLKKPEIVIVAKKRVFLSSIWIDRMYEFFSIAREAYQGTSGYPSPQDVSFVTLNEGDNISYIFKDSNTTDIFWAHTFNSLVSNLSANEPVYLYNPHQWFILARPESEKLLLEQAKLNGHPWYQYIAHNTPLDVLSKTFFEKPNLVHTQEKHYFKDNYYLNIIGDFLIEVRLDPKTQKKIDTFYQNNLSITSESRLVLQEIISNTKGRNRLTVSRNKRKSSKLRKMLNKYFY